MNRSLSRLLVGLALLLAGTGSSGEVVIEEARDGGDIRYDGVYYDYRHPDGRRAMRLWVPPGDKPVRGIFFQGNHGDGGDTRPSTEDPVLRQFAARHGFAISGTIWFPGGQIYRETGRSLLDALEDFASLGFHPELAHAPFVTRGNSNAGLAAYAIACLVPERVICFANNVGPRWEAAQRSDAVLKVPGLIHIGPEDGIFRHGVADTEALFREIGPKGALWVWSAEQGKGHAGGLRNETDWPFIDYCVHARLPVDADPTAGPVTLKDLDRDSGYLADQTSWRSGITKVGPVGELETAPETTGWLPNRALALAYRAEATYDRPIRLVATGATRSATKETAEGRLAMPGAEVALEVRAEGLPGWKQIVFCENGEVVKTVAAGEPPAWSFTVDGERHVYSIVAVAEDAEGNLRTTQPYHLLVGDPALTEAFARQDASVDSFPQVELPAAEAGSGAPEQVTNPQLVAYGLSPEEEAAFAADGQLARFWSQIPVDAGRATLRGDGAELSVQAAYTRSGLYLAFVAKDGRWIENGDLSDAVDFHICRDTPFELLDPRRRMESYLRPTGNTLARAALQYQITFHRDGPHARTMALNIPDAYQMDRRELSDDAAAARGILIDRVVLSENQRALELFLPWTYVGYDRTGLKPWSGPKPGDMLAISLGYNDQHGEGRNAVQKLRWPGSKGPWVLGFNDLATDNCWGGLLIGPALPRP